MGRVAAKHQNEIERVALKIEGLSDNAEIQTEIVGYVGELLTRTKAGEMATSTMLQGLMPYFWKVVGSAVNRTAKDARDLYFTRDLRTLEKLSLPDELKALRCANQLAYNKDVSARTEMQVVLPLSVWNQLAALFDSWLLDYKGTENDQIARLILALGFFTGRRPFSEIAFTAKFSEISTPCRRHWEIEDQYAQDYWTNFNLISEPAPNPTWADEWLHFEGNGKPTAKEKAAGFSIPLDIPLICTSADDMIEALDRLRDLESDKSWFANQKSVSDSVVRSILQRNLGNAQEEIDEVLKPIYEAGIPFPSVGGGRSTGMFSPYHLRPIYANRCAYAIARSAGEGQRNDTVVTKWILGHMSGLGSVTSYKSFEIVDR